MAEIPVSCLVDRKEDKKMEGGSNGMKRSSSENATNATRYSTIQYSTLVQYSSVCTLVQCTDQSAYLNSTI